MLQMKILNKKKGGYICPKCYSTQIKIKGVPDSDYIKYATCKKCNFDFLVLTGDLIDKGILETIVILNKKGYSTKFSCAGHNGDLSDNDAYIFFENFEQLVTVSKQYPIPESWDIDKNCSAKHIGFVIRSDYKKKTRLNDIYKWALSLPEWPTISEFQYGYMRLFRVDFGGLAI